MRKANTNDLFNIVRLIDHIGLKEEVFKVTKGTDDIERIGFDFIFELLMKAVQSAQELDVRIRVGNILSSDVFYNSDSSFNDKWKSMGVLAVEMEAAGLYLNASKLSKKALCITTISDHLYKSEQLSPQERQTGFNNMINIALETAAKSL